MLTDMRESQEQNPGLRMKVKLLDLLKLAELKLLRAKLIIIKNILNINLLLKVALPLILVLTL